MDDLRSSAGTQVNVASAFMSQVYQWMSLGLAITAGMAWFVGHSPAAVELIFGNMFLLIALFVGQIGLVIALSAAVQRMSSTTASGCFIIYSALSGVTMASIFVVYPIASIANAFIATAGTFLAMSIYGTVTKRDLTSMGSFMTMGLFGIIIASVVNLFLKSGTMSFVISCLGVVIFTGLTAYDTQKIKELGANAPLDDPTAVRRGVILGALTLYLDFINLFLMILRLFGSSRD